MNDRELKQAVDRLPKSIEPPRDLWPAIEARLRRPSRRWYWVLSDIFFSSSWKGVVGLKSCMPSA